MTSEKVGNALNSVVSEPCDYHHALLAGELIWLFGKKYVNQPSHNWGHHVAFAGTYGVAFNLATSKWEEPQKFAALTDEENVSEIMFVLNNAVYILLFAAFGELSIKSAYKWTGSEWSVVKLESFPPIAADDPSEHATLVVAEGAHEDSRYLVSTVGRQMRVAHLRVSGNDATIKHVLDVPHEAAFSGAQAVSAVESGDRLLIGYGVHGCGFRWERKCLIACDLGRKSCEALEIAAETAPKWGFRGSSAQYLTPSGAWVHAGGKVQVGMTGSQFDGSIWSLNNLSSSPSWHLLEGSIPDDGEVVIGQGRVLSIDKDGVHSLQLKEQ